MKAACLLLCSLMNGMAGHHQFMSTRRQRALEFQQFLRLVRSHYRGGRVAILLDEDSSHTAKASRATDEKLGIHYSGSLSGLPS